ncbi:MAG: hypothetical protein E3K36_10435 [Candidatus Brocadia sp.]|nr:hypothetical protein [Candidatus Brocadia sp.]
MKWLNFKHPFYLTTLILCGFTIVAIPHGVIAKEKKNKDKKSTVTAECVLKKITTIPGQELVVERGKGVNVTVVVKCKGDIPAAGVTVEAATLKGKKVIELSPISAVTDKDGKAVFTITGNRKTEEELAEIKFTAEKLATKLAVKVRRTECKPGNIKIEPAKELVLEPGKSSQITVKVICENGSPAVDAKVDALVQVGSDKLDISSSAELTDASGKAVFTVTGIQETKKGSASIRFMTGDLKAEVDVKVKSVAGEEGTETTQLVPKAIQTIPGQEVTVARGKDVNVVVKVMGKGNIPAAGVTVEAATLKGKKAIELSPVSAVTDKDGKAVFTITGNRKTEEELAEIKFTAEKLAAKLAVKVRRTECKPGRMKIEPDQKVVLEQGKSKQVTVKVICEDGSPAVDAKVDAIVQVGSGKIDLSPSAELTDASGKAVFTVAGIQETKKEPATIRFMTEDLKAYLNVKVIPVTAEITQPEEATPKEIATPKEEATPEK